MDVVVWLRSLGLGKHEALFRENEIDETVLPGLTAEDLKRSRSHSDHGGGCHRPHVLRSEQDPSVPTEISLNCDHHHGTTRLGSQYSGHGWGQPESETFVPELWQANGPSAYRPG